MTVYTIGHSTRSAEEFLAMLGHAGVQLLADVRVPVPGSTNGGCKEAAFQAARITSARTSSRRRWPSSRRWRASSRPRSCAPRRSGGAATGG